MSVEVRGIPQAKRLLATIPVESAKIVRREIRRSALNVQAGAKRRAPVDTGRLRNSIATAFENGGLTGLIGTNVEYAKFVEFGTRRARAKPYLHPAFEEEWPRFVARLRAAVGAENIRAPRG